ncbi:MAG: TetR/AcrR family transcriptional regulator [Herbiconiux sp.]|nr:TetR/AcrR family transcriptional regulator [Herbiconiux sp.]
MQAGGSSSFLGQAGPLPFGHALLDASHTAISVSGMPAAPAPAAEVRMRVMVGMVRAVEEKGYANTTVADIAKAAKISRRTLYEHFVDKEACFLAAYSMMSDGLISAVISASRQKTDGMERLRAALVAYLDGLALQPEVARSFLTEINAVGGHGVELRCAVNQRFAAMLADLVTESVGPAGTKLDDGRILNDFDATAALALVGAINEVVLQAMVNGPADTVPVRLSRLVDPVNDLSERILWGQPTLA